MKSIVSGLAVLAVVIGGKSSHADQVNVGSAYQGGYNITFNGNTENPAGAGVFSSAQLNSPANGYGPPLVSVPFMYCIDINHVINLSTTYNASVNTTGIIIDSANADLHSANSLEAREMAWLIIHKATSVATDNIVAGDTAAQKAAQMAINTMAVQAALWKLEYDKGVFYGNGGHGVGGSALNTFVLNNDFGNTTAESLYKTFTDDVAAAVANASTVNLSTEKRVLFVNAVDSHDNFDVQAQITFNANNNDTLPTPVPGTLGMSLILFGSIGVVWSCRRSPPCGMGNVD